MVQVVLGANAPDVSITDSWIKITTNPTGLASWAKDCLSLSRLSYQTTRSATTHLATFIRIPHASQNRMPAQLTSLFQNILKKFICTAPSRQSLLSNRLCFVFSAFKIRRISVNSTFHSIIFLFFSIYCTIGMRLAGVQRKSIKGGGKLGSF